VQGGAESEAKKQQESAKILATAGLILTDAMILQEVLARSNGRVKALSAIKESASVKRALEEEWERILEEVEHGPVFRLALRVLLNLPATPEVESGLRALLEVAQSIASSPVLLRHDLMGRVYHQLLLGDLAKYYATLYTSIPAARLLARLAINLPSRADFSEVPPMWDGDPFRVVDFACGSGTLLSAVYKEIDARHRMESDGPQPDRLHEYLLEDGLWGFDVLLPAAHLTAATLSLHNPSVAIRRSRVYLLPLGVYDRPRLGSIDFLRDEEIPASCALREESAGRQERREKLPRFHMCVMNPPFTRSVGGNLLFGALPREERAVLQRTLQELLSECGISGIGQAGLAAVFVFLADRYLRPGGRLALVLPKSVLSGVSWKRVRELLLERYHVEYVISSYEAPDGWNFSENTSLSEVLMIARKLDESESVKASGSYTIFVNLWRKPRSETEATFLGSILLRLRENPGLYDLSDASAPIYQLRVRGEKIGEAYAARVDSPDMVRYQLFAQAELNKAVVLLRRGFLYTPEEGVVGRIPLTSLSTYVEAVGPDRRQVHDAFRRGDGYRERCDYPALWGHDPDVMRTMRLSPNLCLVPKDESASRRLWNRSGRLVVAESIWPPTYRILAAIVTREVLSNVWWPIRAKGVRSEAKSCSREEVERVLAVWFNSTFGLMALLSCAEVTRGAWMAIKKDALWRVPVIDIRKLDRDGVESLINLYQKVSLAEFEPVPDEFLHGTVRRSIDRSILEALGVEHDLEDLYSLLSVDPTLTHNLHPEVGLPDRPTPTTPCCNKL